MLVCTNPDRVSLWDAVVPPPHDRLPAELAAVDALLDDPALFAPFRAHFHPVLGRPSIAMETYLRMMWLKFRYRLSYEDLCREVGDSLAWRRFCRIGLGGRTPHPTTLMKITTRCGPDTVAALNETLLATAHEHKVIRTDKVRADTTVVEANVAYPTDSGLLTKAVARMVRLVDRIHAAGGATRTTVRDRRRSVRRRAHRLAASLRRRGDDAKATVARVTGEIADLAAVTADDAQRVVVNARRGLRRAGDAASAKLAALTDELDTIIARTRAIEAQTRTRLAGDTPDGATRVVSLHDADARPIAKGRLGKPVEFGYKAQVVDNTDGVVVDHDVAMGNPPDGPRLAPAIARITARFGRPPRAATADRGYGDAAVEHDLVDLGVATVAIPRKGKPSAQRRALEHSRPFRRLIKWRTGSEGRISHLKHGYGWDRTRLDGIDGARTWCGWGVLTHNSVKIAALVDAKTTRQRHPPPPRGRPPPTTPTPAATSNPPATVR